jgi:type III restriction enzyme
VSGSGDFELLDFQGRAARQIADRFELLINDPERPTFTAKYPVPYFQALSALTGAGKTPILAEAVAEMVAGMVPPPIIFWISRLKAVVAQTLTTMTTGGRYAGLIPGFIVAWLEDLTPEIITSGTAPLMVMSTVSYWNQDKDDTNLTVHGIKEDVWGGTPWSFFEKRLSADGLRRPLIIVYDEGHNLTDPQTETLMNLRPDAFLVASATMTLRPRLQQILTRLKDGGWVIAPATDEPGSPTRSLTTQVPNKIVVDNGLVKREVVIGGYDTTMETMVNDLLVEMKLAEDAAKVEKTGFKPRAIYVSQTNIDADKGTTENIHRPFSQRRAPPILIWKHLIARGVDPLSVAVYCDLKFDKEHSPPNDFQIFAGADKDFEKFTAHGFRHVIFNQALQEGWDDPQVAFAYIDKTMGSPTAVEQVIGRVLRQAGAKHYSDPLLNRATFYIRLDSKQQFKPILESVQSRIGAGDGGVEIKVSATLGGSPKDRHLPKQEVSIPKVYVTSEQAALDMDDVIKLLPNYLPGGPDAEGAGYKEIGTVLVGVAAVIPAIESILAHSNRVTARWIIRREIRTLHPRALLALDDTDHRFDATVDRTSLAAELLRDIGRKLVDAFIGGSSLRIEPRDMHKVGPIDAKAAKATTFKNAIHDAYELNGLEKDIAEAIDGTGMVWCRNPENGGWSIPMLDTAGTFNFFPDFLVWNGNTIFALDPKGGHILAKDAWRKVLSIQKGAKGPRVLTRLISEDKWTDEAKPNGKGGYTVFTWDTAVGKLKSKHYPDVEKAVKGSLKP